MSENKVYESPVTNPEIPNSADPLSNLAPRMSRLGAALIDGLILIAVMIPVMFLTGYFAVISSGKSPSFMMQLAYGLLSFVVFMAINYKSLLKNGQTIGKKVAGIRIVNLNGSSLDLQIIAKRYGLFFLVGQIPFIGPLLSLINILFIFGKDQRCIHDLVANTKVIKN